MFFALYLCVTTTTITTAIIRKWCIKEVNSRIPFLSWASSFNWPLSFLFSPWSVTSKHEQLKWWPFTWRKWCDAADAAVVAALRKTTWPAAVVCDSSSRSSNAEQKISLSSVSSLSHCPLCVCTNPDYTMANDDGDDDAKDAEYSVCVPSRLINRLRFLQLQLKL